MERNGEKYKRKSQKIPEHMHNMYEIGLNFDQVYQINNENEIPIGLVFISDTVDENIYIEWLEFLITFRKKGISEK